MMLFYRSGIWIIDGKKISKAIKNHKLYICSSDLQNTKLHNICFMML